MKVVCIVEQFFIPHNMPSSLIVPQKGVVYNVRQVFDCYDGTRTYWLHEIHNADVCGIRTDGTFGSQEPSFVSTAFRRVTDISDLEKLTVIKNKELETV